ncbi:hypothetical protein [Nitrobacter sp.]|uniref:hypothetical protein n=1 Tax=Nitrobacter sp. TaxID=29420 RepID=UPI0032200A5A
MSTAANYLKSRAFGGSPRMMEETAVSDAWMTCHSITGYADSRLAAFPNALERKEMDPALVVERFDRVTSRVNAGSNGHGDWHRAASEAQATAGTAGTTGRVRDPTSAAIKVIDHAF